MLSSSSSRSTKERAHLLPVRTPDMHPVRLIPSHVMPQRHEESGPALVIEKGDTKASIGALSAALVSIFLLMELGSPDLPKAHALLSSPNAQIAR